MNRLGFVKSFSSFAMICLLSFLALSSALSFAEGAYYDRMAGVLDSLFNIDANEHARDSIFGTSDLTLSAETQTTTPFAIRTLGVVVKNNGAGDVTVGLNRSQMPNLKTNIVGNINRPMTGTLTNGGNHTGIIPVGGGSDTWTFDATLNDHISVSIAEVLPLGSDPIFWPYIRLIQPDGYVVAGNYAQTAAAIQTRAVMSGTYIVTVSTFYPNSQVDSGNYVLTMAKSPGPYTISSGDEGGPLTNGANHAGVIKIGDQDTWTFVASIHDDISISIGEVLPVGSDPVFWPHIRLIQPDGYFVAGDYAQSAARINNRAAMSGTYTVIVDSFYPNSQVDSGNYVLTMARSPGPYTISSGDEGGSLTNGANHAGVIKIGDQDIWTFDASLNDFISISVGEVLPAGSDPVFWPHIRLIQPDGYFVAGDYAQSAARITNRAAMSGIYTVIVDSFYPNSQDNSGNYVLTMVKSPGPYTISAGDEGGMVLKGLTNNIGVIRIGDQDTWTFDASVNDDISVNISEVTPSDPDPAFWPYVQLIQPDGYFVSGDYGATSAELHVQAAISGTYTVIVSSFYTNSQIDSANYQLAIDIPPNPVIFIHGIAGSTLVDGPPNGDELWLGLGLDPFPFPNRRRLNLYPNGNPTPSQNIKAVSVIRSVDITPFFHEDVYGPLLTFLTTTGGFHEYQNSPNGATDCDTTQMGSHPDLFEFVYDWRKDIRETSQKLRIFVQCVEQFHPGRKVNILAHSMGGLVARRYILDYPASHDVNRLVTIASPWLGSPTLLYRMETGNFIPFIASGPDVKYVMPSLPAAHELLTSLAYQRLGGAPILEERGFDYDGDGLNHESYNYAQVINFLNAKYPSTSPGTTADEFHSYTTLYGGQDDWRTDATGVSYFHFYGVQNVSKTIGKVIARPSQMVCLFGFCYSTGILTPRYTVGDGTVPEISAGRQTVFGNYNAPNAQLFRMTNSDPDLVEHTGLTKNPNVQSRVLTLLKGGSALPFSVADSKGGEGESPAASYYVSIFGGSSTIVSDSLGHSTAPIAGDLVGLVPGVETFHAGDSADEIVLPVSDTVQFGITFIATGLPTAIKISKGVDDVTPNSVIRYQDLALPKGVAAQIVVTPGGMQNLRYDADGNGTFETEVVPSIVVSGTDALDITAPTISFNEIATTTTQVTITASDDATGIQEIKYSTDGANFLTYSGPLNLDPVQTPFLYAFATDNVGNRTGRISYALGSSKINITGQTKNADGTALAGVTLSLTGAQTATTQSDATGHYSITNVSRGGNYSLTASKAGLTFTPQNQSINNPAMNLVIDFTSDGMTTPAAGINGTVTYGNAAAPPKYISNVTVTGAGSPNVSTTTAAPGGTAGQYTLTGFGAGSYTVSLAKTTGQNSITSNDAARIASHVSGTNLLTTSNQKVSADVTGNGAISSQDAAKIAQIVAGLPFSPPNFTGQWRFFVSPGPTFPIGSSPTSRTYSSITSNITGDDYVGLLIGEVTGNWTPSAARPVGGRQLAVGSGPETDVAVELPQLTTPVDKEVVVPVSVKGVANKDVISYEFNLRYDPSVIQPVGDGVDLKETVSRGLSVVTNATVPGILRVVVYGALPIDENGVLLNLRFTAVGAAGSVSPILFERILFNEGEPRVTVVEGRIELF